MPKSSAVRIAAVALTGFAVRCGAARVPSVALDAGRARGNPVALMSVRNTGGIAEGSATGDSGRAGGPWLVAIGDGAAMAGWMAATVGPLLRESTSAATRETVAATPA
jgi:hypothetical protein